jgi:hypothetical protein
MIDRAPATTIMLAEQKARLLLSSRRRFGQRQRDPSMGPKVRTVTARESARVLRGLGKSRHPDQKNKPGVIIHSGLFFGREYLTA